LDLFREAIKAKLESVTSECGGPVLKIEPASGLGGAFEHLRAEDVSRSEASEEEKGFQWLDPAQMNSRLERTQGTLDTLRKAWFTHRPRRPGEVFFLQLCIEDYDEETGEPTGERDWVWLDLQAINDDSVWRGYLLFDEGPMPYEFSRDCIGLWKHLHEGKVQHASWQVESERNVTRAVT